MHRRVPAALITNSGSPRSDVFAGPPPRPDAGRVLVCSQPLSLGQSAAPPREVADWYAWLTTIARSDDPRVRVRLHPGERSPRYRLPSSLEHLLDEPHRPLAQDLGWADVVLAPFSTVLVEAVGASRVPISAGSTAIWGNFAANAFLEDPRVPSVDFRSSPGLEPLLAAAAAAAPHVNALRQDYLANVGDAARLTAAAIVTLAAAPATGCEEGAPGADRGRPGDRPEPAQGRQYTRPPAGIGDAARRTMGVERGVRRGAAAAIRRGLPR